MPAIVYFSSPDCIPCKQVQGPELARIKAETGAELDIIEVDVQERPQDARAWRVLSLPTTYFLDRTGRPLFVNSGLTAGKKLQQQVAATVA